MRMLRIFKIICAVSLLGIASSCAVTSGKDQLEYENAPYRIYNFGDDGELSMYLPVPTLGERGYLYSNYLRREWSNSGFIDYFPISEMRVTSKLKEDHIWSKIILHLNSASNRNVDMFREIIVNIKGTPIAASIITSLYDKSNFRDGTIDQFLAEDNTMFIKILENVRINKDGKWYKVKVDYTKLADKMTEMTFKPNKPSDLFEFPYELEEAEPLAYVFRPQDHSSQR